MTTCEPEFYKHTQKLFLMLYERGLAYQAEAEVNYDPIDKTVLANEQVDADGRSWRSGAKVEKRKLKQWFFRISEFREALLRDLDTLAKDDAWPERVLAQQRNWLGRSKGAKIKFPVLARGGHEMGTAIEVFTTRPDTLFGVQYLALASTHPTVIQLAKADPELAAFLDTLPGLPPDSKVGYLLPTLRAINPLAFHEDTPDATKASLPVYVASYVLGDYGEGAVMGVPGHDVRDHAFWRTHNEDQPVRMVLAASEDEATTVMRNEPYVEHGLMTEHSGPFQGKHSTEAGEMMVRMLEAANLATRADKWRLRDWLISRQRYWGTPIPIVHCDSCGAVPVPDEDLPVKLPDVDSYWEAGKAGNALESSPDFVKTTCPKCKGPARRDTDTMDTFVDSSWYYARFADPHNDKELVSPEAAAKTLPVDIYLGGVEHAILHLLYARFIYKFLASAGVIPQAQANVLHGEETETVDPTSAEPFRRLITQGMVHGKTYVDPDSGRFLKPDVEVDLSDASRPRVVATGKTATVAFEKMSKSKHNGVDPTDFIARYGADATRAHMLFQAPVGDVLNWDESKIVGVTRWLQRLHDQVSEAATSKTEGEGDHGSIKEYLVQRHGEMDSMSKAELTQWDADAAIWRDVQRTIGSVRRSYDGIYSLNTVVSDLMSLTHTVGEHKAAASNTVKWAAASAMTRMLAPIAPAFAEECWAILTQDKVTSTSTTHTPSMFASCRFPDQDGSEELVRPRRQACAVQVNGKVRGVVQIMPAPAGLEGEALSRWVTDQILETEDGRVRFGGEGAAFDVRRARRAIAVRGGRTINFVM